MRTMSCYSRVLKTGFVFCSLLLAGGVLSGCGDDHHAAAKPAVETAYPVRMILPRQITATGKAEAQQQVDLVARISGTLEQIAFRDGEKVHKGQLLFVIEPAPYQAKLSGAKGAVDAAKAALVKAKQDYARQVRLAKANATSQQNLDAAREAKDAAVAGLVQAQADLDQAKINLGYTHITAPFDGVMTYHKADIGALVSTTTVLASIVQTAPVRVHFTLSDPEASTLRAFAGKNPGAVPVGIKDDGKSVCGRLDYIAPAMDFNSGTLDFRAISDSTADTLLPGSYVRIHVLTGTHTALLVPSRAIGTGQGGSYVYTLGTGNTVRQTVVTVAPGPAGYSEITAGLKAGDRVILSDTARLSAGETVHPQITKLTAPHPEMGSTCARPEGK